MIVGLFGDIRSGKTLSAVALLHDLYKGGYRIYSNIRLTFPYTELLLDSLLEIVEGKATLPNNAVLFLDEITLYMDSRTSGMGNKSQRILSYFMLMSGKLGQGHSIGCYILYTTQFPDLIDKRLWAVSNIKIFCFKQNINGNVFITQYWYMKKLLHIATHMKILDASRYYHLYNTREIVKLPSSKYDKK